MAEEAKKEEKEAKESESTAELNPEQEGKKRKKKLLIFAVLGALIVIGGGIGAFLVLSSSKKTKVEGEPVIAAKAEGEKTEKPEEHGGEKKEEAKADAAHGEEKKVEEHGGGDKKTEEKAAEEKKGDEHGGGEADKKAEANKEEKKDPKVQLDIDFGETYKMTTFNINLGNSLENRYIRMELSLEYKGGDQTRQEIIKRQPQLRDAIIGVLQRKTREFLLAPDGKEALRKEIMTRINRYMKSKIESVYITDMLIE